jgi:hypothetical protein
MNKRNEWIEIIVKLAVIIIFVIAVFGCKTIEYRDNPPNPVLYGGCQMPKAKANKTNKDLLAWLEDVRVAVCDCDSRMREVTGEPISERMRNYCNWSEQ